MLLRPGAIQNGRVQFLGGGGLGSPSYDMAKQIIAYFAQGDLWSGSAIITGLSKAELYDIRQKIIAFGSEQDLVNFDEIAKVAGNTETIEVSGKAPVIAKKPSTWPWWVWALGATGALAVVITFIKLREKRAADEAAA